MNPKVFETSSHESRSVKAFPTTAKDAKFSHAHMPTAHTGIEALIAVTNEGVHLFEERNYGQAMGCFRKALEYSKNIARLRESDRSSECQGMAPLDQTTRGREHMLLGLASHGDTLTENGSSSISASDFFMVQDTCIRLIPDSFPLSSTTSSLKYIATIIVYNCALTLHMEGYSLRCTKRLEKALSLYSHALVLIKSDSSAQVGPEDQVHCLTGHPLLDFVHLALVNNSGIIMRYNSHDMGHSQEVFGRLVTLVRNFMSTYHSPSRNWNGHMSSAGTDSGPRMSLLFRTVNEYLLNAVVFHSSPHLTMCAPSA